MLHASQNNSSVPDVSHPANSNILDTNFRACSGASQPVRRTRIRREAINIGELPKEQNGILKDFTTSIAALCLREGRTPPLNFSVYDFFVELVYGLMGDPPNGVGPLLMFRSALIPRVIEAAILGQKYFKYDTRELSKASFSDFKIYAEKNSDSMIKPGNYVALASDPFRYGRSVSIFIFDPSLVLNSQKSNPEQSCNGLERFYELTVYMVSDNNPKDTEFGIRSYLYSEVNLKELSTRLNSMHSSPLLELPEDVLGVVENGLRK